MFKKKQYNVRKIIFTLKRYDGKSFVVEITGRLRETKIFFLKWYHVEIANPEKIVGEWGRAGFVKVDSRDFMNMDQIEMISYKTQPHTIEK